MNRPLPLFDNIAAALKAREQFVLWRTEPRFAGEEPTKIPYDAKSLRRASSTDHATWSSFATAREMLFKHRDRFDGIGFVLHDLIGVDLDDCRDPVTGIIHPRALEIIRRHATYSEVSPGFAGVKMISSGEMPTPDAKGKNYRKAPWNGGAGGIEMYRAGRFFTLTGRRVDGTPADVQERTAELATLYRELYPPAPPRPARPRSTSSSTDAVRRAAAYMARLPASVSGEYGHAKLLHAACVAIRFGVADADALDLLGAFNNRCLPPWSDREIERKLAEAHKLAGHEFGSMLVDRTPLRLTPSPRRWRVLATIGGAA